jgi:hypothetical protein
MMESQTTFATTWSRVLKQQKFDEALERTLANTAAKA